MEKTIAIIQKNVAEENIDRATLRATFVVDDKLRLYRGGRCELPTDEVVEVTNRRTPFYDLARELDARLYGDWCLQVFTPAGTPSLRGKVSAMAGLTVEEGPCGLRRRKYRPARGGESATDGDPGPEGTQCTGEGKDAPQRLTGPRGSGMSYETLDCCPPPAPGHDAVDAEAAGGPSTAMSAFLRITSASPPRADVPGVDSDFRL